MRRNSKSLKTPEPEETGYCGDCVNCHGIDAQRDVCICDIDNPHKDWRYNSNEPCCDWELDAKHSGGTKGCV